ncbi:MAG: type IV toxin-antitoxin system AbiEi family antitoxin [Arthrobacter sp.]|uniref:type IV toxin-antitoxin system AbiEi family antitoxin n=1 Tax=Arthrobacter sp. TaxID=1667 RepID=UPI00347C1356
MSDPGTASPDPPRILAAGGAHTAVELQAMAADGVLRRVLPGAYVLPGAADGPELRSAAAGALVGPRLRGGALGRLTAAWIYGCAPVPLELEVLVPRFHRSTLGGDPIPVRLSEARLLPADRRVLGGVPVTSPARTALDVAFHSPEEHARPALARLAGAPGLGCPAGHLLRLIEETTRRPGRHRAQRLVRELLGGAV